MSLHRLLLIYGLLLILLPACTRATSSQAQEVTALVGGTVVNPGEAEPVPDATVLIRDGRIEAVGPSGEVDVPAGADTVDASGMYIIPGLVDGHVHFFQSGGLYTRPDAVDLRGVRPYEKELALIEERLTDTFRRYLRSGVTSVVDVGGPMWNFEVRAIADTTAKAPNVVVAGPLISTYQPPELTTDDPPIIEVASPEEARQIVREQVEQGTDLIKIWYIVQAGETPEQHLPIINATIDESRSAGVRVAVHATQLETARTAVEAGADILVHSVFNEPVDDAFIDLLRTEGTLYIPTVMVGERYQNTFAQTLDLTDAELAYAHPEVVSTLFDLRALPDSMLPARVQQAMQRGQVTPPDTTALDNLDRLHEAGVTIVTGTDAGNIGTLHGPSIFREMQRMQEAGLTPKEILTATTLNGAKLMGQENELGTIEAGKRADLVVLRQNPLDDIRHVSRIHRVVKDGRVYTPRDLIDPSPEDVVQQQVNAYNAGDLDAFLAPYADDVAIYQHPDSLMGRGTDMMRRIYGRLFERAPNLHAAITNRMVLGNTVIDREHVTGLPDGKPLDAIAIYEVQGGVITKVWFVQPPEPETPPASGSQKR